MAFKIIIATLIISLIICLLHNQKKLMSLIRWFYSGKHPQQKYYRSLYKTSEEQSKKLEIERIRKNGE